MNFFSILITILVVIAALAMLVLVGYVISSLCSNWDQRRWY